MIPIITDKILKSLEDKQFNNSIIIAIGVINLHVYSNLIIQLKLLFNIR